MSKHRGHVQHEIADIVDVVHDFSNLPDCILHKILSLMPTKEAVKTSILSTRWKNLWTFIPNIDIDDELLCDSEVDDVASFVNFVERVLQSWDASNTKKFRFSFLVFCDASIIHSWISHAIMHNVLELDLTLLPNDGPSVIPRSMFDSTSLVSLKIRMACVFELPSHVSFPCLKTLHLSLVRFPDDDFIEKLFSGCPVLEELVLFRNCFRLKNITISSSTLKSLTIHDMSRFWAYDDPCGCKIKIDAENLTYFEYTGFLSNEIILNNTPSLVKSFIDIPNLGERLNKVACRAIELLKKLENVVSLRLSDQTLKALLIADNIRFPLFPNLTHLMLTMEIKMNNTSSVLKGLLSFGPVVQSICFCEEFRRFMRFMHLGESNSIWSSMPICISNSLKTVTLKNFHGYNPEICFLKRILKYACALERMDIWWSETYLRDQKRKTKVRKELEKTERSATACVIKFS